MDKRSIPLPDGPFSRTIPWRISLDSLDYLIMYEKAGLSSLERLIGKGVSSVCFLPGYVQLVFEEVIFTCYTNPTVVISGQASNDNCPGFKDRICQLIGQSAQSVEERSRQLLAVYFDSGDSLNISLRFEDAKSVEAAMLSDQTGVIFNVWRYE
jgi:hypothetical protein